MAPSKRTTSNFYAVRTSTHSTVAAGPISRQAIQRDAGVVVEGATSLLGYQEYLAQARSWKAKSEVVPAGFECEVQAQAARALADTRAVASATLRMTSQFKHSGELDRMLSNWVTTIRQTGPVHTSDLLSDVQSQPGVRQALRDRGVTDDIWNTLITNLKNVDGNLFVHEGKLAADLKLPGHAQTGRTVFAPSATGMPRTLSDLMRRGSFERQAALFNKNGGAGIYVVAGPQRDLELPELVLAGSILGVQSIADHHRSLQDVGLAKYTGRGWFAVGVLIALVALGVGAVLKEECKHDPKGAECIVGEILFILAALALALGAILLIGVVGSLFMPPSTPLNPAACPSGKICYSPIDGSTSCC